MVVATVATGNHFVIDVGPGLLLTAAGLGMTLGLTRISLRARSSGDGEWRPARPRG